MEEIFLFLNKYTNIGYISFFKIYNYLNKNIENFFKLKKQDFVNIGLPSKSINKIFENLKNYNFIEEKKELKKYNINICSILDNNYPYLLKQISDSPIMFYYKGELVKNDNTIAIIGSRKFSNYGEKITKDFSLYLSNYFSIVSGFAYGIDSLAHNAAVLNKKRTIAVMGIGLDTYYPYSNKDLAKNILDNNGLLISEFPTNTRPLKSNFPRRNRIISGLSSGVLVVEASIKSGTFITANYALDQGRDLFVIPGSIYNEYSNGTNELIKRGANFVTSPKDIVEMLETKCRFFINGHEKNSFKINDDIVNKLNDREKIIFNLISYDSIYVEEIFLKTNIEIKELVSILGLMEIKGIIKNDDGRYIRT